MIGSRSFLAALLVGGCLVTALSASTAKAQDDAPIYGRQLMTQQEQQAYRQKIRVAKTPEEREQIRAEHHRAMQERAQARGVTLPDMPPAQGMGGGKGPGGQGMGPGGRGMGPGGGGNSR
jgi:hypothetical protein